MDPETGKPGSDFLDESEPTSIPVQTNYQDAEKLAQESWRALNPRAQSERCGARLRGEQGQSKVELKFFQRLVEVSHPGGVICEVGTHSEIPIWERILVLHYLSSQSPVPLSSEWIDFGQVPSGGFYLEAFRRRAQVPIARLFGRQPKLMIEAARSLGASLEEFGDVAVKLRVFPLVPVVVVLYAGDDEFQPESKMLFDSSITAFLCTEDIAVVGGMAVGRLIQMGKSLQEKR